MFTFIETRLFSRIAADYLSDDEYARVQAKLVAEPESGPVIPGSGGVRKLRWGQPGRGKRGGIRIIYYLRRDDDVIWMLTIYAKNEIETISPRVLRQIKEEIDGSDQA